MNALDRIFQAYDAIRTEGHADENDAPPWKPPAVTAPAEATKPTPEAAPRDEGGYISTDPKAS